MFMVFNKEKISSYMVILSTVFILFGFSFIFNKDDSIETSGNIQNTNTINNRIQNNENSIIED